MFIQNAELLSPVAQNWHNFFRSYEEKAKNRRKHQKSMSLSLTSETAVEQSMNGDDNYMFCVARVNDLFVVNNEQRELDRLIYTVLTKLMHQQGLIQQSNTQKKHHCRVYGVRLYKSTLRLQRNRDECTQRVFYEVENKENMIAGVIGYDSIRKHLGECVP